MAFFAFDNIRITAIASAVPKKVVCADDYVELFGDSYVQDFVKTTGVKMRHVTHDKQTASDLGYIAAKKIIEEKQLNSDSIGAVIFGSHSADYRRPATACVLHKRLKLPKDCMAFDVGLGCSAFVYCIQVASSLMQNSDIQRVMVIVGETMSKLSYPEDKSAAMLFGDAGSAILLEKVDEKNCIRSLLKTDGEGYRSIIVPAGGFRQLNYSTEVMEGKDGNKRKLDNVVMNGVDVFSFSIRDVPKAINQFFELSSTNVNMYDCFAVHQANGYILNQLRKKIKIPAEKMPSCLERYGNTSAPSIPLLLCDTYGSDTRSEEKRIIMCGFGVGLSWGVLSASINVADIYSVIESDDYFEEGMIYSLEDL